MRIPISKILKAIDLSEEELLKKYGITAIIDPKLSADAPLILRQICHILKPIPPSLVKDCSIKKLLIKGNMGPCKPYYPNHGYYVGNLVALNANIFLDPDQPDDFIDHQGYFLTRPQQTLLHELGHGYDAYHQNMSLNPQWLKLSGWSENIQPGLKRLLIRDTGTKPIIGEWYFYPKAQFTRFYAKKNPWDDFADTFSFYIAPLKDKVPSTKTGYFDSALENYYK